MSSSCTCNLDDLENVFEHWGQLSGFSQYESSNVFAAEINGTTTLFTGGKHVVSLQYELLNVNSN
jgi:hypothetical protein